MNSLFSCKKYVKESEYENTAIVYIPNDSVDLCYNDQIGWIRTDDNYENYIL